MILRLFHMILASILFIFILVWVTDYFNNKRGKK
jgi:hypothetical protein